MMDPNPKTQRITGETSVTILPLHTPEQTPTILVDDPVLKHMLKTLLFYMEKPCHLEASGDLLHHLWEDIGITLGMWLSEQIDRNAIARFGQAIIPMDDALVMSAVDISRPWLSWDLSGDIPEAGFEPGLARELCMGLARSLATTIHVRKINGDHTHHLMEAAFKSLGKAFAMAFQEQDRVMSTKGLV